MLRLILKFFLVYWLAAEVVILIDDLKPHNHIYKYELSDALAGSLAMNGRAIVDAYERGQCQTMRSVFTGAGNVIYLADAQGRMLCGDPGLSDMPSLVAQSLNKTEPSVSNHRTFQVLGLPVLSDHGQRYVVLIRNDFRSPFEAFGLLPGNVTMLVSIVVTFFLAVLVALPIRRLRRAANLIASGKLDTRVRWGPESLGWAWFKGGDDIHHLMLDFNLMAEKLEKLSSAQRLLLRDVSHELRSPLTRMGVGLSIARSGAPQSMQPHLDRIAAEAGRLNDLIGQILELSKMESIPEVDISATVSLTDLATDIVSKVEYEATYRNCWFTTAMSSTCYVKGDQELLSSALENIMRNAIKYAPDGSEIKVETTTEQTASGPLSKISVSDRGPGVPLNEIDSVLEPFYRADRLRNRQVEGAGIGLAIANRAAILHRGVIHLRNRPTGGLIVEICLPGAKSV